MSRPLWMFLVGCFVLHTAAGEVPWADVLEGIRTDPGVGAAVETVLRLSRIEPGIAEGPELALTFSQSVEAEIGTSGVFAVNEAGEYLSPGVVFRYRLPWEGVLTSKLEFPRLAGRDGNGPVYSFGPRFQIAYSQTFGQYSDTSPGESLAEAELALRLAFDTAGLESVDAWLSIARQHFGVRSAELQLAELTRLQERELEKASNPLNQSPPADYRLSILRTRQRLERERRVFEAAVRTVLGAEGVRDWTAVLDDIRAVAEDARAYIGIRVNPDGLPYDAVLEYARELLREPAAPLPNAGGIDLNLNFTVSPRADFDTARSPGDAWGSFLESGGDWRFDVVLGLPLLRNDSAYRRALVAHRDAYDVWERRLRQLEDGLAAERDSYLAERGRLDAEIRYAEAEIALLRELSQESDEARNRQFTLFDSADTASAGAADYGIQIENLEYIVIAYGMERAYLDIETAVRWGFDIVAAIAARATPTIPTGSTEGT